MIRNYPRAWAKEVHRKVRLEFRSGWNSGQDIVNGAHSSDEFMKLQARADAESVTGVRYAGSTGIRVWEKWAGNTASAQIAEASA